MFVCIQWQQYSGDKWSFVLSSTNFKAYWHSGIIKKTDGPAQWICPNFFLNDQKERNCAVLFPPLPRKDVPFKSCARNTLGRKSKTIWAVSISKLNPENRMINSAPTSYAKLTFFLFFCGTEAWTLGLMCARQALYPHESICQPQN
jgi:hypothetical protein